jgi:hypothetical protein
MKKIAESRWGMYLVMAMVVLTHLPFISEPPRSIHVWRQSITLAMARNLHEEGMNILEPKVDRRYDTNGITGSQFLSYEWGLAALYKIFGWHEPIHRWWSMFWYVLSVAGMYHLILLLTKQRLAAWAGSWIIAFSPELYYQGINALPDVLALAAMVWAIVKLIAWDQTKAQRHLVYFFVWITLAGLTKIQFMGAGVWAIFIFLKTLNQLNIRQIITWCLGGIISIGSVAAWYIYANYLTQISGLLDVGLMLNIETDIAKAIDILQQNLVSDLPELLLGFGSFALFVIGILFFFKNKYRATYLPILYAWAAVLIIYHLLVLAQMGVHQYYMLSYLPLLSLVATYGFIQLYQRIRILALILLLIAPILAIIRIAPARWSQGNEGIPMSFYNSETRKQIEDLFDRDALVIAGPDPSGCIFFYFTHTKGFSYNTNGALFDTMPDGNTRIHNYTQRGASYLIMAKSVDVYDVKLQPHISNLLFENEEFVIFMLKKD